MLDVTGLDNVSEELYRTSGCTAFGCLCQNYGEARGYENVPQLLEAHDGGLP
jgi:hypothetical protein